MREILVPSAPVDVAVVGGGPVGLALALSLHAQGAAVRVFDARPRGAAAQDPRVLALSHGTRLILENLGVWRDLPATPIETIHISQQGGFGRVRITAQEQGVEALGYVVGAGALAAALDAAAETRCIAVQYRCRVASATTSANAAVIHLENGTDVDAALIAWAEGGIAGGASSVRDYDQHAIICSAETVETRGTTAYERFTPDGPMAALPYGSGWSIVFAATPERAEELIRLDDRQFLARLQDQFGGRLHFTSAGPRQSYPLLLRLRQNPTAARQVWLGNAAQTLHPVAGQGFNLAARDVAELARKVGRARASGVECGDVGVLRDYAGARAWDRRGVIGFTDSLVRLFSNDFPPLRHARGLGLLAIDLLPPARSFIAKRMMFGARAWP